MLSRTQNACPTMGYDLSVALFLEGRITFVDIASAIESALETLGDTAGGSRDALLAVDSEARRHVRRLFSC